MSVSRIVEFAEDGDPTVTVTVTGSHDVLRFTYAMSHLQCEFADVARKIGGTLKRRWGAKTFRDLHKRLVGTDTYPWIRHDPILSELIAPMPTVWVGDTNIVNLAHIAVLASAYADRLETGSVSTDEISALACYCKVMAEELYDLATSTGPLPYPLQPILSNEPR